MYISTFDIEYIKQFPNSTYVFLSLHIPEEMDDEGFKAKALEIISLIKENGNILIVDISPSGVDQLGYDDIYQLSENLNIDYVRLDFGFEDNVSEINSKIKTIINASTILETNPIPRDSLFMHNFYLRKDTGLSKDDFDEINTIIKEGNSSIFTFIPGDEILRGPIFEGLCTLESQRDKSVYINFLEMYKDKNIDGIFISDPKISQSSIELINKFLEDEVIRIESNIDSKYCNKEYQLRSDQGANVFRISFWKEGKSEYIEPANCIAREAGSITIDNVGYKRYMGEIQISKIDLDADDRVNVLGIIDKDYLSILKPLDKIMFISNK